MEVLNVEDKVMTEILKCFSVVLSSSTVGQIAMDLMINPPTKETVSEACWNKYNSEMTEMT